MSLDTNKDGKIDFNDVELLIASIDTNKNSVVDEEEISYLLEAENYLSNLHGRIKRIKGVIKTDA